MLRPSNAQRVQAEIQRQQAAVAAEQSRLEEQFREAAAQLVDVIAATTPVLFVSEGFRW